MVERTSRIFRLARTAEYVPGEYWERRHGAYNDDRAVANRLDPELDRYASQRQEFLDFLQAVGYDVEQHNCLEFGCGNGFWAEVLLESGAASYTGVDISPTAITRCKARQLPRSEFACMDLTASDFRSLIPMDLSIAIDVIQHIVTRSRLARFMSNLESTLAVGGVAIVTSYTGWGDRYADPEGSRRLFGIWKVRRMRTVYMWETETLEELLPGCKLIEKSRFWDKTIFAFRRNGPAAEVVSHG